MKKKQRVRDWRKQKLLYEHLFYVDKDPVAANLMLLIYELERFYEKKGVLPCFGNFKLDASKLNEFILKNDSILFNLFTKRFPDPREYNFGQFGQEALNKLYSFYMEGD